MEKFAVAALRSRKRRLRDREESAAASSRKHLNFLSQSQFEFGGEAKAKELKAKLAQLLAKAKYINHPNLIEEVAERVIPKEKHKPKELELIPNLIEEVGERSVIPKEKPKPKEFELIPDVEWWDVPFLRSGSYGDVVDGGIDLENIMMDKINIYIEHPLPIEPPAEPAPQPQPWKLTEKEKKKLRTQRRLAREKDKQEMIRLGVLEPPPKPKVKMSNLMKVLPSEATQDPTKLDMEIRSAAAERERAHTDRNIARKLTPAERREKKERKLFGDDSLETIVSVYKINDLSHPPQARFKVDVNAQENRLSGCAIISERISLVVVEGGSKSIKRYGKLMLKRIDWSATVVEKDDDVEKPVNRCLLVWQGSVAQPNFNRFMVQECRSEAAARKFFSDHGVAHYWDLALNFTSEDADNRTSFS